ncbi:MAG: Hsp20/alpha crystallin family protein [Patescibacteria group bacterium]
MAIIRWTPWGVFPRWRWLEEEEEWPELTETRGLDVYETENEVVVKAAVPGVPEDKIEVTFEDGVLRIRGKVEETEEEKKRKKVVYRAQRMAAFDYTTTLPRAIDATKLSAELEDGVLTVKAPISPGAKSKKISVKAKKK